MTQTINTIHEKIKNYHTFIRTTKRVTGWGHRGRGQRRLKLQDALSTPTTFLSAQLLTRRLVFFPFSFPLHMFASTVRAIGRKAERMQNYNSEFLFSETIDMKESNSWRSSYELPRAITIQILIFFSRYSTIALSLVGSNNFHTRRTRWRLNSVCFFFFAIMFKSKCNTIGR